VNLLEKIKGTFLETRGIHGYLHIFLQWLVLLVLRQEGHLDCKILLQHSPIQVILWVRLRDQA